MPSRPISASFAVIQKHDFAGIRKQWRNVGRDEVFARSETQHKRRALAGRDDLVASTVDITTMPNTPSTSRRARRTALSRVAFEVALD